MANIGGVDKGLGLIRGRDLLEVGPLASPEGRPHGRPHGRPRERPREQSI
jgi:hypothetical protein